jgi:hypothetical protein
VKLKALKHVTLEVLCKIFYPIYTENKQIVHEIHPTALKPKVIIAFHGHTNNGNHMEDWANELIKHDLRNISVLSLSAPYEQWADVRNASGDILADNERDLGREWFSYKERRYLEDNATPLHNPTIQQVNHLSGLMYTDKNQLYQCISYIKRLATLLLEEGKTVLFAGTSQGATISFIAALYLLREPNFCGGYFHHMAGTYPELYPMSANLRSMETLFVDSDITENDTHGEFLEHEKATFLNYVRDTRTSKKLIVELNADDKVIKREFANTLYTLQNTTTSKMVSI